MKSFKQGITWIGFQVMPTLSIIHAITTFTLAAYYWVVNSMLCHGAKSSETAEGGGARIIDVAAAVMMRATTCDAAPNGKLTHSLTWKANGRRRNDHGLAELLRRG